MDFPDVKVNLIIGELQSSPFNTIKNISVFAKLINETYPKSDIVKELKKMKLWLSCHPPKRQYSRFIVNWLSRNDKGWR